MRRSYEDCGFAVLMLSLPLMILALSCGRMSNEISNKDRSERKIATVTASVLNLRSAPSIESPTVGSLPRNAIVTLIVRSENVAVVDGHKDYWYRIEGERGEVGWAFGGYLAIGDPISPEKMVEVAWSLNETNPRHALELYERALKRLPHGLIDMSPQKQAHDGITVATCYSNRPVDYSEPNMAEFKRHLGEAIRNRDSAFLEKAASCSFSVSNCGGIIDYVTASSVVPMILRSNETVEWREDYQINETTMNSYVKSPASSLERGFLFSRDNNRIRWTGYCDTNMANIWQTK